MAKPKETKILLVQGLQNTLCNDPKFSQVKARILKQVRRHILDSISYHRKRRHVLLLNNPNLSNPETPEDMLYIFGRKPLKRQQAYRKTMATSIDCPTPDPFYGTKLDEILSFLTRKKPYSIELCGFGYDRIWLSAMACAIRGMQVTILSDMVGAWWAYEFQEEDRIYNPLISIKMAGKPSRSLGKKK